MSVMTFEEATANSSILGGKAWGLARLFQAGFNVPGGLILTQMPDPNECRQIQTWWQGNGAGPLAVRSSAAAEDGAQTSFAGQNQSFLNVSDWDSLQKAMADCFSSGQRKNSKAYRQHFLGSGTDAMDAPQMNVVIQKMVNAKFAGVYFTSDPRKEGGWILEVISGLGEELVSGHVTPGHVEESGVCHHLPNGFESAAINEIVKTGAEVAKSLGFPVDMEWAIDINGQLFVLQARPITTHKNKSSEEIISFEMDRLIRQNLLSTTWDGQTFSEWNGLPSPFTFSLWQEAFSPQHAFGMSLQSLGYLSFKESDPNQKRESLLESVFGRAVVNLDKLTELYYGPIPYKIIAKPRPHSRFDFKKININMILHMPRALASMFKVAWNVSSRRRKWLEKSEIALLEFKKNETKLMSPESIQILNAESLKSQLLDDVESFTKLTLQWPLLLVVLTESTIQSLKMILQSIMGQEQSELTMRRWMANGLHTVTKEMSDQIQLSAGDEVKQKKFIAAYGHRGPGEMELAKPRWSELGFKSLAANKVTPRLPSDSAGVPRCEVEFEIGQIQSLRRDIILQEWRLFKDLLENREAWKMEILKSYNQIRLLLLRWGEMSGLGDQVFWLHLDEVKKLDFSKGEFSNELAVKIQERKAQQKVFSRLSLPDVVSLEQLRAQLQASTNPISVSDSNQKKSNASQTLHGEPLSPGVTFGEVRIVEDPDSVDFDHWPENTILVAHATDPGWTPLFLRSQGIIVEKGGVLSHCAIVARELSLPAVSGIAWAQGELKDGDHIWLDGNTGQVTQEKGN